MAKKMKQFTILENEGGEVMMIHTTDIYDIVELNTSYDHSYIMEDGELRTTEDYFDVDYFDDKTRIVLKIEDIKNDKELMNYAADCPHLTIKDPDSLDDEDLELIDVTDYYCSYVCGKAVDVEHGINTTRVVFDHEDMIDGWKSIAEVDADYEVEHVQDYPRQEHTRIYTCDNGKRIRCISPFFADQSMNCYEYID